MTNVNKEKESDFYIEDDSKFQLDNITLAYNRFVACQNADKVNLTMGEVAGKNVYGGNFKQFLSTKMTTCFKGIHNPYFDPIFSITSRYKQSSNPKKVNLGVGAYRDHNGKPYVLNVIRKVEQQLAYDLTEDKEYLDMSGLASFVDGTLKLVFGPECKDIETGLIGGVQSISGTGAIRLAFDLLHHYHNISVFYCPDPTWPIHNTTLSMIGVKDVRKYKYYDNENATLYWDEIVATLNTAPENSAIILQGCGHNPTGLDFSEDQWKFISKILIERKLIPIIDLAYLGFVTGDVQKDNFVPKLLHSLGKEMLVCVSYAKNLGLYNERAGVLAWYAADKDISNRLKDRLIYTIRNMYSCPPAHGAKMVSRILNDSNLMKEWQEELSMMSQRIHSMREGLYDRLIKLKTPGNWTVIIEQRGLFSYTGITKQQVQYLESQYHIYMLETGRVNISALTEHNLDYVANAIHDAVTKFPKQAC